MIKSIDNYWQELYNPVFDTKKNKKALQSLILLACRALFKFVPCTLH